jgi:hypothetical protein
MEPMMAGELGAVVERDGLAKWLRQAAEQLEQMPGNTIGDLVG